MLFVTNTTCISTQSRKLPYCLSSRWHTEPNAVLELTDFLVSNNVDAVIIIGTTPDFGGKKVEMRGSEIQDWLLSSKTRVPHVIFDDIPFTPHNGRAIWTDPRKGLNENDMERALFKMKYQKAKGGIDAVIPAAFV